MRGAFGFEKGAEVFYVLHGSGFIPKLGIFPKYNMVISIICGTR